MATHVAITLEKRKVWQSPETVSMGKDWAIAIGINQYDNLTPLKYAKRDAELWRDFCLGEVGFERVYYFSDDSPPIAQDRGPLMRSQPTYGVLSRFLRVRFEQSFMQPGDNFWFFFAGHGKRHRNRDYLMPMDADPGNVEGTAIAISDIANRLRHCGADNIILVLDACRSEGDRDGQGVGLEEQQGVVTLFACSPNEQSYEIDDLQQGSFTHVLLQALRIQGEGNCATVERLCHHLRHQVPELNRRHSKPRQTPYSSIEPDTKLHLILLPKSATLADVNVLKGDAWEAETEGELELAEHLWTRVLAVSPADVQAIKAIKRIAVKSASATVTERESSRHEGDREGKASASTPSTPTIPVFEFEVVTVTPDGKEASRRRHQAQYFSEDLGNGVVLEIVSIPGGTFQMGSPETEAERLDREGPQHSVTVKPFLMGKYPVTQAQWQAVAAFPQVSRGLKPNPSRFKGANRPVEQVSWHEAVEFCARLSKRTGHQYQLPSEAEWEYACRAGTTTPFHFGETIASELANYDSNYTYGSGTKGQYRQQTTSVGSFQVANAFGLYDMHGNVWEWCLDHWHGSYEKAPIDGSAWMVEGNDDGRMLRGGSWGNYPRFCRSAYRFTLPPDFAYNYIGFRVVCVAPRTL